MGGDLIKTKYKFRYNFKDVAVTFNGLDNFMFFKASILLLIYADQGVKSIQDRSVRPSSTLPPLFYARNGRWDYRPVVNGNTGGAHYLAHALVF